MTCIVGIKTKEGVYLGADSMVSRGWTYRHGSNKIVKKGPFLFASCGLAKGKQVIQHHWTPPKRNHEQTTRDYVEAEVGDSLIEVLDKFDCVEKDKEFKSSFNAFIFAYEGMLFCFDRCGFVDAVDDFFTHGCGGEIAFGSLFTTETMNLSPEERIKLAIQAAGNHSNYCDDNVTIEFQPVKGKSGA